MERTYMGQLHAWNLAHASHPHADRADAIACDEELAYAIESDETVLAAAANLAAGDVIRRAAGEPQVIITITKVGTRGDAHAFRLETDRGPVYAYPGRTFQVYA